MARSPYAIDGNVYTFGEKGAPWFARGVIAPDGRRIEGRRHMPGSQDDGYDWVLTRIA